MLYIFIFYVLAFSIKIMFKEVNVNNCKTFGTQFAEAPWSTR